MKQALFAAVLLTALTAAATADAQRGHGRGHGRGHNPHAEGRHDNGHHRGWDRHRYIGYSHGGAWYYGPPPAHLGYVEYGYRAWRHGAYLPPYYLNAYPVVDYHAHHLAPPPYGAHYVLDDRGDYLLVGIATGLIMGVILADGY
jgi:Ni/Co efflux regulator RcnB